VFSTQFNHETMRQRQAAASRRKPGTEHLIDLRSHPPSRARHRLSPRPPLALALAHLARRMDEQAARRGVA
jgi:hypothetical protein